MRRTLKLTGFLVRIVIMIWIVIVPRKIWGTNHQIKIHTVRCAFGPWKFRSHIHAKTKLFMLRLMSHCGTKNFALPLVRPTTKLCRHRPASSKTKMTTDYSRKYVVKNKRSKEVKMKNTWGIWNLTIMYSWMEYELKKQLYLSLYPCTCRGNSNSGYVIITPVVHPWWVPSTSVEVVY